LPLDKPGSWVGSSTINLTFRNGIVQVFARYLPQKEHKSYNENLFYWKTQEFGS